MAKILPGLSVAKMSGTVGGTTYQNWRGILVARSKPTPTNTSTPRQSVIRALMTSLARAWRDELTPSQRIAWNQRAKSYPWLDVFGNAVSMTGLNLYLKQNLILLDHSRERQDTPAPDVIPPELELTLNTDSVAQLTLDYPQLAPAVVTSQAPFLHIVVAGGFLTAVNELEPGRATSKIDTLALPAGRKHQKSDFRHCLYVDDYALTDPPAISSSIEVTRDTLVGSRNVVVSVQRFNCYGNFSAPALFSLLTTR